MNYLNKEGMITLENRFIFETLSLKESGYRTKTDNKRFQMGAIDTSIKTTYYSYCGKLCAKSEIFDYITKTQTRYLMFHTTGGMFCKVSIDYRKEGNKIHKVYEFDILSKARHKTLVISNKDFDILRDKERGLIMLCEQYLEVIEHCDHIDVIEQVR